MKHEYEKEIDFSEAYKRQKTTETKAMQQVLIKSLDALLLMAQFLVLVLGDKPVTQKDKGGTV